jgi:hypothetical protein
LLKKKLLKKIFFGPFSATLAKFGHKFFPATLLFSGPFRAFGRHFGHLAILAEIIPSLETLQLQHGTGMD